MPEPGKSATIEQLDCLIRFAKTNARKAAELAWDVMCQTPDIFHMMYALDLYSVVVEGLGRESAEELVRGAWQNMDLQQRRHVAFSAHRPEGLSLNLIFWLFEDQTTTIGERRGLAAGLVVTARQRQSETEALQLLDRIGRFENPQEQKELERFIADAKKFLKAKS